MSKEKKAFKDTLFGKIVNKGKDILTDVPGIVRKAAKGDYLGAVADVMGEFSSKASTNPQAKALLNELTIQFKQIELEFARVELEETKIYLLDVQNARSKEIELAKLGKNNWFHYFVGVSAILLLGFCLYALVFLTIPEANRGLFNHFIGIIEGVSLTVYHYEYGSSKGSKDKTNLLSK